MAYDQAESFFLDGGLGREGESRTVPPRQLSLAQTCDGEEALGQVQGLAFVRFLGFLNIQPSPGEAHPF